jgi:NADPH:quinone reductase-like Zn-dependent oxidoreductase
MKTVVSTRYGSPDVLEFRELAKPIPRAKEILIKILATTVTSGDWRVRSLAMPPGFRLVAPLIFGIAKPRQPVLGSELAGEVVAIGTAVTKLKVGDQVFAFSDFAMGCHAEYKCMPENDAVALKPANLSDDEAAALSFGGTTALAFFRKANLLRGEKVLINGASGSVGTAAVQLAKHFGAIVTGVCSAANAELVHSLGATHVIDYTKDDFTRNGETYDVIVDTAGTAPSSRSSTSLKKGGRLLLVLSGFADMLKAPWQSMTSGKKVIAGPAAWRTEDLQFLASLAAAGEFRPVIDRRYPFEQIADAHRYVDTGRKRGNVVVTLLHEH